MIREWTRVRTMMCLRATELGNELFQADLMIDGDGLYNWNVLALRPWSKMAMVQCCRALRDDAEFAIHGEASEPVMYTSLRVYHPEAEKCQAVADLLNGAKTHKGDDLMALANAHGVVIYPVTHGSWLFYDGLANKRHTRQEFTDLYPSDYVSMYLQRGMTWDEYQMAAAAGMHFRYTNQGQQQYRSGQGFRGN